MTQCIINFKPLEVTDLEKLFLWFQKTDVRKWYAKGKTFTIEDIHKKYLSRIQGKERIPSYIIAIDSQPVGFIQYYGLNDFLPEGVENYTHKLFQRHIPPEMAGIDLFISEETHLNKGYGPKVIKTFLKDVVFPKFKIAVVDPNIENVRALKAYRKVGFENFSVEQSKNHHEHIQLMICPSFQTNDLSVMD